MHQDSYFPPNAPEEYSDVPQLAFPEPQLPFPEPLSAKPEPAPRAVQQAPTTPANSQQAQSTRVTGEPQLDFPEQGPAAYNSVPFRQPSTETIDVTQLSALQRRPPAKMGELPSTPPLQQDAPPTQVSSPQQSRPDGANADQPPPSWAPFPANPTAPPATPTSRATPVPDAPPMYSAQLSGQLSGPQSLLPMGTGKQVAYVPGLVELPFTTQSLPIVMPRPELEEEEEEDFDEPAPSNQQAKRAIINGIISFAVSLFTLVTVAGSAGLIIGAFAIMYGLVGLRQAQRMPEKTGLRQAIVGGALGLLAWVIVIAAFVSRAPLSR